MQTVDTFIILICLVAFPILVHTNLATRFIPLDGYDGYYYSQIADGCQTCSLNKVCDKGKTSCNITICLPLEVENAKVLGNLVNVGSRIKIVPDPGYMLTTNSSKSMCQENGTWSNVPSSISTDCGDPPTISNATHSGSSTSLGSQIDYACMDGFHVNDSTVDMKIKCMLNTSSTPITINWSPVMFQCIDCGDPPTILNATHSGLSTSLGSQIDYACMDGFHVNDSTVDMKIKCMLNTSSTPITINWSPVMFQCIDLCPPGWIGRNQSCYMFSDNWLPHDNASANCSTFGAHLVTIESEEENEIVKQLITDNYVTFTHLWIGIDDKENEEDWVYTHTQESITFQDWVNGQPNNFFNEDCAVMHYVSGWHDWYCSSSNRFICEKAAVVPQQ